MLLFPAMHPLRLGVGLAAQGIYRGPKMPHMERAYLMAELRSRPLFVVIRIPVYDLMYVACVRGFQGSV